jgi:hypothetical protein
MSVSNGGASSGRTASQARSPTKPSSSSRSSKSTANKSTANKSRTQRSKTATRSRSAAATGSQKAKPNVARSGDSPTVSRNGQPTPAQVRRRAIARIGVPAMTGAVGIAGGVVLGRTTVQHRVRKALGNPVPGKVDFSG